MLSYLVFSTIDINLQASKQPEHPRKSKQNDSESSHNFKMTIEFGSAHSSLQHRQGLESVKYASIYIKHSNSNQYLNFHDDPISYECVLYSWDHPKLNFRRHWMARLKLSLKAHSILIACCPSLIVLEPLSIAKTSDFSNLEGFPAMPGWTNSALSAMPRITNCAVAQLVTAPPRGCPPRGFKPGGRPQVL